MAGPAKKLLLVDDEPGLLLLFSTVLERNGYTVMKAGDGKEAITACEQHGNLIAAILSDINMPRLNGVGLARVNSERFHLPFIAITSQADHETAYTMLGYGVQDYLIKPVSVNHLLRVVRYILWRSARPARAERVEGAAGEENIGQIVIPSTLEQLRVAQEWLMARLRRIKVPKGDEHFILCFNEFLMNAHEHGNLGIREAEKSRLIESGGYEEELMSREAGTTRSIKVEYSLMGSSLSLAVEDEGLGFNFRPYMAMGDLEMTRRMMLPNGRGIQMGLHYFDKVEYTNGGRRVTVVKSLAGLP